MLGYIYPYWGGKVKDADRGGSPARPLADPVLVYKRKPRFATHSPTRDRRTSSKSWEGLKGLESMG